MTTKHRRMDRPGRGAPTATPCSRCVSNRRMRAWWRSGTRGPALASGPARRRPGSMTAWCRWFARRVRIFGGVTSFARSRPTAGGQYLRDGRDGCGDRRWRQPVDHPGVGRNGGGDAGGGLAGRAIRGATGRAHPGRSPPERQSVRSSLAAAWPMVTASFILGRSASGSAVGGSSRDAAWVALGVTVVLLVIHGHAAATAAGLRGLRLVAVTGTAGLLGVAMVVLKTLLQHHHY